MPLPACTRIFGTDENVNLGNLACRPHPGCRGEMAARKTEANCKLCDVTLPVAIRELVVHICHRFGSDLCSFTRTVLKLRMIYVGAVVPPRPGSVARSRVFMHFIQFWKQICPECAALLCHWVLNLCGSKQRHVDAGSKNEHFVRTSCSLTDATTDVIISPIVAKEKSSHKSPYPAESES